LTDRCFYRCQRAEAVAEQMRRIHPQMIEHANHVGDQLVELHRASSPEKIGKTESHGCIRLTNWDALDLASMVSRGTVVDFEG